MLWFMTNSTGNLIEEGYSKREYEFPFNGKTINVCIEFKRHPCGLKGRTTNQGEITDAGKLTTSHACMRTMESWDILTVEKVMAKIAGSLCRKIISDAKAMEQDWSKPIESKV